MLKESIITDKAPKAVGPYSQAILKDGILYVSGQLPIDPLTNEISNSIATQAKQCMENLKSVLLAAEFEFFNIVRCGIYLKDINDFSVVNDVYSLYFNPPFPSRTTIAVSNLPRNALIEIDAIAMKE